MALRSILACLVVVATGLFVVGVAIERSEDDHHDTRAGASERHVESGEAAARADAESEGEAAHSASQAREADEAAHAEEPHEELRPLGIDVEAWPFVAVAALVSLALAAGAWLRAGNVGVLAAVASAMLAFAALDVREVVHQVDIDEDELAVLAGAIAALHIAAGLIVGLMLSRARTAHAGSAGPPGTIPA